MSIILPNLNHSFISPVPVLVPVLVPDPDFRFFHTPELNLGYLKGTKFCLESKASFIDKSSINISR